MIISGCTSNYGLQNLKQRVAITNFMKILAIHTIIIDSSLPQITNITHLILVKYWDKKKEYDLFEGWFLLQGHNCRLNQRTSLTDDQGRR